MSERKINLHDNFQYTIKLAMYVMIPLIMLVVWIFAVSFGGFGELKMSVDETGSFSETFVVFSMPMLLFMGAIPIAIKHYGERVSLSQMGLKFRANKTNIVLLIINFGVLVAAAATYAVQISSTAEFVTKLIHIMVIGITEEIMMRGIVFNDLEEKFNTVIAIVLNSLIFAFIYHSGSDLLSNLLVRFPLGLILSLVRVKTKNVYNSIVMHSWYNMLMLVI